MTIASLSPTSTVTLLSVGMTNLSSCSAKYFLRTDLHPSSPGYSSRFLRRRMRPTSMATS